jgi:hypothetical protein
LELYQGSSSSYAQFTRAFLSFYNASEDGEEQEIKKEVSIGHVFRDISGEDYIVAGVNFHFDNDLSTVKEDPLVEQGRLTAHCLIDIFIFHALE